MFSINNKKILSILFLVLLIIFVIFIVLFTSKTTSISCNVKEDENIYNMNINIDILYKKNIISYKKNTLYEYQKGYLDNLVDKYDNVKKYLDYLDNNINLNSDIQEEGYNLKYNIEFKIDDIDKKDYKLLEIEDLMKLKEKKDIINYYEKQGYTCK